MGMIASASLTHPLFASYLMFDLNIIIPTLLTLDLISTRPTKDCYPHG
ncbi:uncharacterized protein RCO7_14161 [Rhynchosporium graminicola]|uniref:Uncharacterized protein n=1 Tax=Rhynchosporium graminicola TaxID=2792576 RepID=A0A1E1JVA2_9HELO|nr:uncharacterized protein RCO7_14161 [Rhynchosporium commune]